MTKVTVRSTPPASSTHRRGVAIDLSVDTAPLARALVGFEHQLDKAIDRLKRWVAAVDSERRDRKLVDALKDAQKRACRSERFGPGWTE